MKQFFKNNWIVITIAAALTASMVMAIRNKSIIEKNSALQQQSIAVKSLTEQILSKTIHGLDLGLRGFAITHDDQMLIPYREAITENNKIFHRVDSLLRSQQYQDLQGLKEVETEVDKYIALCNQAISAIKLDTSLHEIITLLKEDRGYDVWKKYNDFSLPLFKFEDGLYQAALANYNEAILTNLVLQVCIVLLALPALIIFLIRIRKEREARQRLLMDVEQNDRKFMFDPGTEKSNDTTAVLNTSIKNAQAAADFVKSMAKGNYDVEWSGLTIQNKQLNQDTLAGHLIAMREKMKLVKKEDVERNWLNQGLAKFSELVRNHQGNRKSLGDQCVSFLAKYLHAQQCSLFTLAGDEADHHLELTACYAFDKKKWIDKRVDIGAGLVGQAYLEGDVILLKEVPPGYTKITSGLGEATPRNVVIIPLRYDVQIAGIMELASFEIFEENHITFLKKAGEFLASALINSQTTRQMQHLLDQAKINEEQMRQREEELRQNMEELQATQEDLLRKEREMQGRTVSASLN
jgi:CHASE3 domain sensor protein